MTGFGKSDSDSKKQKRPKSGPQLLEAAVKAHQAGDLTNAEVLYLKTINSGFHHEIAFSNLGIIYKTKGKKEEAIQIYKRAISSNPKFADAYSNLGNILRDIGEFDQALSSTLKSRELKPENPITHMNLGVIYKDLGNLDHALTSTLKSIELQPNNPDAYMNLGDIYKDLGNLKKALACTLKSLELKPQGSSALCKLGQIKMSLGETGAAKKYLLDAIACDDQEHEAHYCLSLLINSSEDAKELIEFIYQSKAKMTQHSKKSEIFIEFALSNCFHKLKKYDQAAKHLKEANLNKSALFPSNYIKLLDQIKTNLSPPEVSENTTNKTNQGSNRIFIVGMPRSGSTLLETILSMNPEIKALGESRSLAKAVAMAKYHWKNENNGHNVHDIYSQLEPTDGTSYTVDKQLYNFIYISWIVNQMPEAKIIHCRRNPMDNILSMYRSNLSPGNNYTSIIEDATHLLIEQEKTMQIQKKRYGGKIFTFSYDKFISSPEVTLEKLLVWLGLKFDDSYLHPERSNRTVLTASVMEARKPISNSSVGGWKNYENLLRPALAILQKSNLEF